MENVGNDFTIPWTLEELTAVRRGVIKFQRDQIQFLRDHHGELITNQERKWVEILRENQGVFHASRTPGDIKDAWGRLVEEAIERNSARERAAAANADSGKRRPFGGFRIFGTGEDEVEPAHVASRRASPEYSPMSAGFSSDIHEFPNYCVSSPLYSPTSPSYSPPSHWHRPSRFGKSYSQSPSGSSRRGRSMSRSGSLSRSPPKRGRSTEREGRRSRSSRSPYRSKRTSPLSLSFCPPSPD